MARFLFFIFSIFMSFQVEAAEEAKKSDFARRGVPHSKGRMAQYAYMAGLGIEKGEIPEGTTYHVTGKILSSEQFGNPSSVDSYLEPTETGFKGVILYDDTDNAIAVSIAGTQNLLHALLDANIILKSNTTAGSLVVKLFRDRIGNPLMQKIASSFLDKGLSSALQALSRNKEEEDCTAQNTASESVLGKEENQCSTETSFLWDAGCIIASTLWGSAIEAASEVVIPAEVRAIYELLSKGATTAFREAVGERFSYALKQSENLIQEATKYAKERGCKLFVTGHSLGGALATLGAMDVDFTGVDYDIYTFCSPGVKGDLMKDKKVSGDFIGHVHNIGRKGDVVFHSGEHVGEKKELEFVSNTVMRAAKALEGGSVEAFQKGEGTYKAYLGRLLFNHKMLPVLLDLQNR